MQFYHILLFFQSHSPRFLPCTEITWSLTLCLHSKCMIWSILEIVGNLVFVNKAIDHWVYLNIHISGGLVIPIFIGFYVIRGADHVLTLIQLLILGALISLVHKLFFCCIWIIVGGNIQLPQMGVATISTSRSRCRCIENIMAINAQIFV